MRRIVSTILVIGFAAAMAWASGDPWKSKPFQQWDEKDVRRILTESPWARPVQVHAPWMMDNSTASLGKSASATQSRPIGTLGGGAAAGPTIDPTQQIPLAGFVVRWFSSRTVRAAGLRGLVLSGQLKQEDADMQAAQEPGAYLVLIAGPDMTPFDNADAKVLINDAFLVTKKSKQKIQATGAEVQKSPDGKSAKAVIYSFPSKSAGGEATISGDEKVLDFLCTIGGAKVQVTFDLSKMEDKQGRDL